MSTDATDANGIGIVVVAEAGSGWTSWTGLCRAEPDDAAVIAQQPGERAAEFARRATQRIARLAATGQTPRTAVLAMTPTEGDLSARALIGRALLANLRGSNGTLVLAGHSAFPSEARHEVFGLAQALAATLFGTPLDIHVKFTDEPAASARRRLQRPLAYTAPGSRRMHAA